MNKNLLIRHFPREAVVWTLALIGLSFFHPETDSHLTFCPLSRLGFDFCPGCGLGRSIALVLHGELKSALYTHPLGIFAVIILPLRIVKLTRNHFTLYGQNH